MKDERKRKRRWVTDGLVLVSLCAALVGCRGEAPTTKTVAPAPQQPTITATSPIAATASPTQLSATGTPEPSPTPTIEFPAAEPVRLDPSRFDLGWEKFDLHYDLPRDAIWVRVGSVIVALTPEREQLALHLDPHHRMSQISLQVTADGSRMIYGAHKQLVIEDLVSKRHWHVSHRGTDLWPGNWVLAPDGNRVAFLTNPVACWINLDDQTLHPFSEAYSSKVNLDRPRYFAPENLFSFNYSAIGSFFPQAWVNSGILGCVGLYGTDGGCSALMRVDFEKKQIDTVHPLTSRHIAPAPDGHQLLYIERVPYAFPPFETKYGVLNLATGHAAELGVATDAYIKFGSWSPSSTAVALFIDEYGTEWGPEWLDIAKVASGWRSRISIAKFAAFGLLKEVVWRDEHDLLLLFQQPEAMQYRFYLAPAASLTPENLVLLAEFIDPPAVSWRPGDVSIVYVPQP